MKNLFSPFKLNNYVVKNRFVRSATTSYWSDEEGVLRQPIIDYYEQLSQGGVGLIIKGHSYISLEGKAHTGQSGLCAEHHLPKMRELTSKVHENDTLIIAQLNHGGYSCKADRVSPTAFKTDNWESRALNTEEIEKTVENFASSARLAMEAGFDGVQIHAAHGYLISLFLSDLINQREDKYGGNLENRARILYEAVSKVKKELGNEPILSVKLNCDDFAPNGGLTVDQSIQIAQKLVSKGLTMLELSGGGHGQVSELRRARGRASKDKTYEKATFSGHAEKFRVALANFPLAVVEKIRDIQTMGSLLENDVVDFVSMSKPFIIEPDLPKLVKLGQSKSSCIDCNRCVSRDVFGKMMLKCHKNE